MNAESRLLTRYLDGELTLEEAARFRRRLLASPDLRQQLAEMRHVGVLLRTWADEAEMRAQPLLEPTLSRTHAESRPRGRHVGVAAAAMVLFGLFLHASAQPQSFTPEGSTLAKATALSETSAPAAIERLEAGDRHAQVFVVGSGRTPVVWLADESSDEADAEPLGPG